MTARVQDVLALTDRCCDKVLDVEYRTACRRVPAPLRRPRGPEVFRRKGRAESARAALVWTVRKANDLFEQRTGGVEVGISCAISDSGRSSIAQHCTQPC